MKKIINILAVLAAAQVLLISLTQIGGNTLQATGIHSKLLSFNKDEVDSVVIKDNQQESKLVKKEGKWQLADGFPITQDKLDNLISKLQTLKYGLPIATSEAALKRFKVDKNDYIRQITLQKGDNTLASLYIGTGAGARQSHVRNAKENAIYSVELGSYDVPAEVSEWQDKNILTIDKAKLSQIKLDTLTLQRDQSAKDKTDMTFWKADKLPEGKLLNQKAINDELPRLLELRFRKVLGKEKKADYGLDKPVLALTLYYDGKQRDYQFGKQKDKYVLKVSDRPEYFEIASYIVKPMLKGITVDKWLMDKVKPEDKSTPKVEHQTTETKVTNKTAEDSSTAETNTAPSTTQ